MSYQDPEKRRAYYKRKSQERRDKKRKAGLTSRGTPPQPRKKQGNAAWRALSDEDRSGGLEAA